MCKQMTARTENTGEGGGSDFLNLAVRFSSGSPLRPEKRCLASFLPTICSKGCLRSQTDHAWKHDSIVAEIPIKPSVESA